MANIRSPDMDSFHQTGDYIVPSYSENGVALQTGTVVGTEQDLRKSVDRTLEYARRNGGVPLPPPAPLVTQPAEEPKGKRKKKVEEKSSRPLPAPVIQQATENLRVTIPTVSVAVPAAKLQTPEAYVPLDVVFHNRFGKITVSVEHIIEEDTAICLVFATERELRFIPEQGEELNITINTHRTYNVMYPGFLFRWVDGSRRLMVLVKINKNEETSNRPSGAPTGEGKETTIDRERIESTFGLQ